jgi:peptidoglycan/xylan/chitin deacetylase (PgdA/CDA1 family)
MYHSISENQSGPEGAFTITPRVFRQHIQKIKDSGWKVAALSDVASLPASEPAIVISFDDGYADNLDIAAPILREFDFPFTIFIITNYVKERRPGYLSPEQVIELSRDPRVTLGTHGQTHRPLAKLSLDEARTELLNSKRYLEDLTGKKIEYFSFPHGSESRELVEECWKAGYRAVGNSVFGTNPGGNREVKRLCLMARDELLDFELKARGNWDWYAHYQKVRARIGR